MWRNSAGCKGVHSSSRQRIALSTVGRERLNEERPRNATTVDLGQPTQRPGAGGILAAGSGWTESSTPSTASVFSVALSRRQEYLASSW